MQFRISRHNAGSAFSKLFALTILTVAVAAWGQTAADLAAKYPSVSAYEVRPGILMTAKYAADGQICEMVLEPRHYQSGNNVDLETVLPAEQERQVLDELVPASERGEPKNRWSKREPKDSWLDPASYMAGGVSYFKRSYENVSIEQHGYYRCHDNPNAKKTNGKLDCGEGGDEVVVVRWTKRSCTVGKSNGMGQTVPAGDDGVKAGEVGKSKEGIGAGEKSKAGGSPEGDGLSAFSGERFLSLDSLEGQGARNPAGVRGQDKIRGTGAQSGSKATTNTCDLDGRNW